MFAALLISIMDKELIPSSNQNPITGDHMITKASNETYRNGWDRIFGEKDDPSASSLDLNVGSDDLNVGSEDPPSTEDSEVFETTEELYKSWGYYDWSEDKPRNKWIR